MIISAKLFHVFWLLLQSTTSCSDLVASSPRVLNYYSPQPNVPLAIFLTANAAQVLFNCNALQHTATYCNTIQCNTLPLFAIVLTADVALVLLTSTHCTTLQHNTTQSTAKNFYSLPHSSMHMQPRYFLTATRCVLFNCNALQHTATHCITSQHTATHSTATKFSPYASLSLQMQPRYQHT